MSHSTACSANKPGFVRWCVKFINTRQQLRCGLPPPLNDRQLASFACSAAWSCGQSLERQGSKVDNLPLRCPPLHLMVMDSCVMWRALSASSDSCEQRRKLHNLFLTHFLTASSTHTQRDTAQLPLWDWNRESELRAAGCGLHDAFKQHIMVYTKCGTLCYKKSLNHHIIGLLWGCITLKWTTLL